MEDAVYITTTGKPSKLPIKLCKDAVKFYGRYLLKDNMYHKISVNISFEKFDSNYEYAYCEWEFDNHRAKDFIITINKDLNKKQTLLALAHEMVHVKQYAKGELKDYLTKVTKSKWRGVVYDTGELDYWDHPWEIEAHGREKGLYFKFLDSLRDKK